MHADVELHLAADDNDGWHVGGDQYSISVTVNVLVFFINDTVFRSLFDSCYLSITLQGKLWYSVQQSSKAGGVSKITFYKILRSSYSKK